MSADDVAANYNNLKQAVRQLGMHHRLGVGGMINVQSFPYVNLSYSSSGEDLWIRQFVKARLRTGQPGFYVDLGCNEPMGTSNTYLYYSLGWRGICIDANLRFRDEFATQRERDVFVHAAVSDTGQTLYFAELLGQHAGHKVARVRADRSDFPRGFSVPIEVPPRTLADILHQHVLPGTEIDFMSVDLEDSELSALRSNDWNAFKPKVILIEAGNGYEPLKPLEFPTIKFLTELGYVFQGSGNLNVMMTLPNS